MFLFWLRPLRGNATVIFQNDVQSPSHICDTEKSPSGCRCCRCSRSSLSFVFPMKISGPMGFITIWAETKTAPVRNTNVTGSFWDFLLNMPMMAADVPLSPIIR